MQVTLIHGTRHRSRLKAFAEGVRLFGHTTRVVTTKDSAAIADADVIVSYGNIRVKPDGRPWLHIDSGYFNRQKYLRCSLNCNQPGHYIMNVSRPPDRWNALGVKLQDWKYNDSGPIILCASSIRNFAFLKLCYEKELKRALKVLRSSGREVIFRPKSSATKKPLSAILKDASRLVTWGSGAAVEAVVAGVPTVVLSHSAASPMCRTNLFDFDNPVRPDRLQWCYNLAYQQWTIKEFRRGLPWAQLMG